MFPCFKNIKGQSLLEVIVAVAVFALVGATMVSMVVGGFTAMTQGGDQTEAEALAQEGIEAVKSIRDRAWNEAKYNQSGVSTLTGEWTYLGEGTTETIGQYTRTIAFSDVCRDALDDITTCPGTYTDVNIKKVTVTVSWETSVGATNSVQKIAYVSNWDSQEWTEDTLSEFTDRNFVDDPIFTNTATSTTLGDGDGAVVLDEQ